MDKGVAATHVKQPVNGTDAQIRSAFSKKALSIRLRTMKPAICLQTGDRLHNGSRTDDVARCCTAMYLTSGCHREFVVLETEAAERRGTGDGRQIECVRRQKSMP
jgi:hypothetical protein